MNLFTHQLSPDNRKELALIKVLLSASLAESTTKTRNVLAKHMLEHKSFEGLKGHLNRIHETIYQFDGISLFVLAQSLVEEAYFMANDSLPVHDITISDVAPFLRTELWCECPSYASHLKRDYLDNDLTVD